MRVVRFAALVLVAAVVAAGAWAASPLPGAVPSNSPVICIDPGHPSEVGRGTAGRSITEIHAAWVVALKLRAVLEARGMRVVMTKTSEDEFVTNRARAMTANDAHADYMIRLHCDSGGGTGIATYAPDRQGVSGGVRGPSAAVIRESGIMGRAFHAAMIRTLGGALRDRGLLSETQTAVGGRQGALTGSIYSRVPVVLVEMCVLTNPKDEQFILHEQGQNLLARAMADGVVAALRARRSTSF